MLILRGGRASGKSKFWAQKVVYRILADFNKNIEHRFVILRKSGANCDRSVVSEILGVIKDWGLQRIVDCNKTAKLFSFVNGSQIMCTGVDDPEKTKSLYKPTSLVFEEATEFSYNDLLTIIPSMRGDTGSYQQSVLCFNPISIQNYIFKNFFAGGEKPNITYHLSTFRDNPYVGVDYGKKLEQLIGNNKNLYNILIEGEWGSTEGLIFDYNSYEIIPEWQTPSSETVYGLDFGYVDPTAMTRCGEYKDGFIIDQLYYETNTTVEDLIRRFTGLIDNKNNYIYCDNARPDSIETIYRAGYNAHPCDKGQGSIKSGIDFLLSKKLYITQRSHDIIKELQMYSWKKTKDGDYIDEPLDAFNHSIDSFRYAIVSHFANRVVYKLITGSV